MTQKMLFSFACSFQQAINLYRLKWQHLQRQLKSNFTSLLLNQVACVLPQQPGFRVSQRLRQKMTWSLGVCRHTHSPFLLSLPPYFPSPSLLPPFLIFHLSCAPLSFLSSENTFEFQIICVALTMNGLQGKPDKNGKTTMLQGYNVKVHFPRYLTTNHNPNTTQRSLSITELQTNRSLQTPACLDCLVTPTHTRSLF